MRSGKVQTKYINVITIQSMAYAQILFRTSLLHEAINKRFPGSHVSQHRDSGKDVTGRAAFQQPVSTPVEIFHGGIQLASFVSNKIEILCGASLVSFSRVNRPSGASEISVAEECPECFQLRSTQILSPTQIVTTPRHMAR